MSAVEGGARPVRAAGFAVATVAVASIAHSAAGGDVPPVRGALAAGVCCWLLGLVLARRRWGVAGLFVLLGAAQVVLHEVFHRLEPVPMGPAMDLSMPGMDHQGMAGMSVAEPAATVGPLGHDSLLMAAAHVAAVLVTAVVLAAGEAAWAMARRLRRRPALLLAVTPTPAVAQPWRLVTPDEPQWVVRLVGPARRQTRRGPPARPAPGAAAAA